MASATRWAVLLALAAITVSSIATPAAAYDDDDCRGCAPGSCDRLPRANRGGVNNDDYDRYYYSCRQCLAGYTLVNDTDDGGVIYGECVCDAAKGFGRRRVNGRIACAPCPANTLPLSCGAGLLARFDANTRAWTLRLGSATSCRDFDWDDFRPEWKPEVVPRSTRVRMRVPAPRFAEFQCVACSQAGRARQVGGQCVAA